MTKKAVHVVIEGRVQGVWFRGWMKQEARALNVHGWVRNRFNGSVEAVIAGTEADVDKMLELCWLGPPSAKILAVTTEPTEDPGGDEFHHLSSA
jgi:acylphosphatase